MIYWWASVNSELWYINRRMKTRWVSFVLPSNFFFITDLSILLKHKALHELGCVYADTFIVCLTTLSQITFWQFHECPLPHRQRKCRFLINIIPPKLWKTLIQTQITLLNNNVFVLIEEPCTLTVSLYLSCHFIFQVKKNFHFHSNCLNSLMTLILCVVFTKFPFSHSSILCSLYVNHFELHLLYVF